MNEKGYVYVLTNPSFKEDWVKIGKSSREINVRSKELSNTAVPLDYEVYATLRTEKYNEAEKLIHRSIDRISDLRINQKREFFNIAPEKAYGILCDVKELLGDEAEVKLYGDNIAVTSGDGKTLSKVTRGERFDFFKKGIRVGEIITFIDDPKITAVVASNRQVLFEEKLWYLSPLTRELYDRRSEGTPSGSFQGPLYFLYNNKRLIDI
jgi:hypothetical protein